MNESRIFVAYRTDSFEIQALRADAEVRNLPVIFGKIDDMVDSIPAPVLFWRSGNFTAATLLARDRWLCQQSARTTIINFEAYRQTNVFSKSMQHAIMTAHVSFLPAALKSIPTFTAETIDNFHRKVTRLGISFPVIAKPDYGARGEGIVILTQPADVEHLPEALSEYVFQAYVANKGDYRVLVVGGVVHDCIHRQASSASNNAHLNNISQGGVAERVAEGALRQRLIGYATKVASCFKATLCGVDILEDDAGALYFLEVNFNPQWEGLQSCSPYSVATHLLDELTDAHDRTITPPTIASIHAYYQRVAPFLSQTARIHYFTRMYLWTGDASYRTAIEADTEAWWSSVARDIQKISDPSSETESAASAGKAYRAAAKLKHPLIAAYNAVFFKVLFDQTVFSGRHYRQELDHINRDLLRSTHQALLSDPTSLFTLSTPAVNFLYLCDYFFAVEDPSFRIDPSKLLDIAQAETVLGEDNDRDARIYFCTHAIIGASAFYSRPVSPDAIPLYHEMLAHTERTILADYVHASLDHKCEFIVCAKIIGYESVLYHTILHEVRASFSTHGNYVTNVHNTYSNNVTHDTADGMEHTNVLAVMAFLADYRFVPRVK